MSIVKLGACLIHFRQDPVTIYRLPSPNFLHTPSYQLNMSTPKLPPAHLVALPSLTKDLARLPTMHDIDPNLLHPSLSSRSRDASEAKLKDVLKRNNLMSSCPSDISPHKPPSSDSEEHIVMSRRPSGQQLSHWSVSSEDLPGTSYPPTREDYHSGDPIILQDYTAYEFDGYVGREFTNAFGRTMRYARFKQRGPFIQNHPNLLIIPLRLEEDNDQEGPSYFQPWYHRMMKVMGCCGMRN